jgi:hypothetical protein
VSVCFGIALLVLAGCGRSVSSDTGDSDAGEGDSSSGGFGDGGSSASGNAGRAQGASGNAGGGAGAGSGARESGGAASGSAGRAGSTGGADAGGFGASAGASGGNTGDSGGSAGESECAVAVRLDECCSEARPVMRAMLESDPCLLEYPPNWSRPNGCEPIPCPAIVCENTVVSRLSRATPSGLCEFVSECATTSDCTLAADTSGCCVCAESFPKALVETHACLAEAGAANPPACAVGCGGVLCGACDEPAELACLVSGNAVNRCGFVPATSDELNGKCTTERACVADRSGIRCYAPDESVCAGPAPPQDECNADADCTPADGPMICEPAGHCGMTKCVPGCIDAMDCEEFQECSAESRCTPKACAANDTCGADHACVSGICTRRKCESSSECEGYCVKGSCYDTPGSCWDAFAP